MAGSEEKGAEGRRPTIRDVAAAAGVSKSLVSLVFAAPSSVSDVRRERVLAAAEALGFRPNQAARSLAATHGGFVGVLVADLHNPVFADLVDAARTVFAEEGVVTLVTTVSPGPAAQQTDPDRLGLDLFGDLRPTGLLIAGSVPDMSRLRNLATGRPVVVASAIAPELPEARTVRGDDRRGVELLVRHLAGLGHRDIAHVGGAGGAIARLRAEAYRTAMVEQGLGEFVRVASSDYSEPGGRAAAGELLGQRTPPTAILAVNDLAGIGALAAVQAAAAPVAVTGYDATFLAALDQIDLTTVDPDSAAIGREAARLLLAEDGPAEVLIPPRLIPRSSSRRR